VIEGGSGLASEAAPPAPGSAEAGMEVRIEVRMKSGKILTVALTEFGIETVRMSGSSKA